MEKSRRHAARQPGITVAPTEEDVYASLELWLRSILPDDVRVITTQNKPTPPPVGPYIEMAITQRTRYATNSHEPHPDQTETVTQPLLMVVKLIAHGAGAGDMTGLVSTLWGDPDTPETINNYLACARAVKSSEPRQNTVVKDSTPSVDGWTLDLTLDVLFSITLPCPSALDLKTTRTPADLIPS